MAEVPEVLGKMQRLAERFAALQEALKSGRVCPQCGWFREREEDPLWGCVERDGLTFSVCPRCGLDWPD